jgi:hypothetical protein
MFGLHGTLSVGFFGGRHHRLGLSSRDKRVRFYELSTDFIVLGHGSIQIDKLIRSEQNVA